MTDIGTDIEIEIAAVQQRGQRNYIAQCATIVTTILCSLCASLSVALEWFWKDILAVLSALPAAILTTSINLNFETKVKWCFEKYHELKSLLSALKHEGLSSTDASKKEQQLTQDMSRNGQSWNRVGVMPNNALSYWSLRSLDSQELHFYLPISLIVSPLSKHRE
ncbi:hypothetical protein [Pseudomonas fluorescens]|uniref:hypothetical protein n=1 Tax=Pseudomonas fluorescens TaxID=294 RepID=UPI001240CD98|nr:hypothetical protein [Pseudomonas fluorescens]